MNLFAKAGVLLLAGTLLSAEASAGPSYSEWGQPENLGCAGINSEFNDVGPGTSRDGLSLYFASNREAPSTDPLRQEIYVAQRQSTSKPWGSPIKLGPAVNSPGGNAVSLSRDQHWLFFNSNRPGGQGDVDIWASYRTDVHDDFSWQQAVNLGAGVNGAGFDAGASYFENDEGAAPQLFFGRGVSGTTQGSTTDIWVADQQPDGSFGNARPVPELNSPNGDQRPSIRHDGLEIFFFSNRPGSTLDVNRNPSLDIWVARRAAVEDAWNTPVNLGSVVNTDASEFNPHISADGGTLYFASSRSGCGAFDLYATTRTRLTGRG
jgi:WD40-like Beta Propeller Repeat